MAAGTTSGEKPASPTTAAESTTASTTNPEAADSTTTVTITRIVASVTMGWPRNSCATCWCSTITYRVVPAWMRAA